MKAIITDLDRTLLRTDKRVSEYTLDVLKKCHEQGILLMAASARPLRDILLYHNRIGFDAITATNGALISLPGRTQEFGISRESGEQILAHLLTFPDVTLSMETSTGFYANLDIPEWEPILYDQFPNLPPDTILYKILASSPHASFYKEMEQALTADVYHTIANHDLIQIMSKEASKWNGVLHMLTCFGISPEDSIYFGDDNDDIEPIRNCGTGIAVSNAIPAVLEVADQVTDSNDQDGVAKFLESTILYKSQEHSYLY